MSVFWGAIRDRLCLEILALLQYQREVYPCHEPDTAYHRILYQSFSQSYAGIRDVIHAEDNSRLSSNKSSRTYPFTAAISICRRGTQSHSNLPTSVKARCTNLLFTSLIMKASLIFLCKVSAAHGCKDGTSLLRKFSKKSGQASIFG